MENKTNSIFEIIFVRHGESIGNAKGYHQGQFEFPLTNIGKQQVQSLAKRWKDEGIQFDHVISSPQDRAKQSTEIICNLLNLSPSYDSIWKERDNGVLGGLLFADAASKYPQPDFVTPYEPVGLNGESTWELYLRGGAAIQSVLKNEPGRYLIVSHGGILSMVLRAILGITPHANYQGPRFILENASISKINYDPGTHQWSILQINDITHWKNMKDG